MDYLQIKKVFSLFWAILFSLFLPFGVFLTVYGFLHIYSHLSWGILGIILSFFSFYIVPFLWIHFAKYVTMKKLGKLILADNIYSVSQLCNRIKRQKKYVVDLLKKMIQQGFLQNYTMEKNEFIVPLPSKNH